MGVLFWALCEGSFDFGSILIAPDFWKHPYHCVRNLGPYRRLQAKLRGSSVVRVPSGASLQSQVAQKRPVYPKVAHNGLKLAGP